MRADLLRWLAHVAIGAPIAAVALSQAAIGQSEWASPWAFGFAIPVLLLPFQRGLTGTNALAVPIRGPHPRTTRLLLAEVPDVLRIAGLLLMVAAMAKPRITHRDVIQESDGLDVLLAIDTSGSMKREDIATAGGYASRLAVAKAVAAEFVAGRPYDRIGLVVFGEQAFTQVPLTLDHDALTAALAGDLTVAGQRDTAVGTAIAVAAKRMKGVEATERIVILVTDGRSNAGAIEPIEASRIARALAIRVYTIGVGAAGVLEDEGIDEPMMRAVAEQTGGRYFRATDRSSLESVYATIDELQPSPAKVVDLVEHRELFQRPLAAALALLSVSAVLSFTWLRRSP